MRTCNLSEQQRKEALHEIEEELYELRYTNEYRGLSYWELPKEVLERYEELIQAKKRLQKA